MSIPLLVCSLWQYSYFPYAQVWIPSAKEAEARQFVVARFISMYSASTSWLRNNKMSHIEGTSISRRRSPETFFISFRGSILLLAFTKHYGSQSVTQHFIMFLLLRGLVYVLLLAIELAAGLPAEPAGPVDVGILDENVPLPNCPAIDGPWQIRNCSTNAAIDSRPLCVTAE